MKTDYSKHQSPVIPFVNLADLDADSRAMIDRACAVFGFLPNSVKTYLHRPSIAATVNAMFMAIWTDPESTLPTRLKAKISLICTTANGCAYCTSHQCENAQRPRFGGNPISMAEITALVTGADEGADPTEKACFAYARMASFDPHSVTIEMLERLKAALTAPQIVELAALVGSWKMINTIHDTLHIPIEEGLPDGAALTMISDSSPSD